ncbi:MAG: hypothetical protein WA833_00900 [Nitrosotalea sp.]
MSPSFKNNLVLDSIVRNWKFGYKLSIFVILAVFFSTLPNCAASSTSPQVIVQTDKNIYDRGDVMIISGEVRHAPSRVHLTIQIVDPNLNIVHVDQILLAQDGRFSLIVLVDGPLWKAPGNYTVIAQYGPKNISSRTPFQFEETMSSTTGTFNVSDNPSGQNFDLNYTITGGTVKSMYLVPQDLALMIELDTKDQGIIHLQIPRLMLDAKKSGNIDESFIVLVNDDEISSVQEEMNDSKYRVIDIPITNDDSKIEVIGTQIIPEFPFAFIVLIISVFATILISRMQQYHI